MKFKSKAKNLLTYLYPENLNYKKFKNCILRQGCLEAGPAFEENENTVLEIDNSSGFDMSFYMTDCYIYSGTKYGRIALVIADNFFGSITYNITFIAEDGETKKLGYIEFASNGMDFGYPDSFTFFSGRKTVGDGIYFLSRRLYENSEDFISLREYSFEEDRWILLTDSSIYAPTLLEYGRGETFHFASAGGNPLQFPKPTMPEQKNLLSARFISKFTTDGMSAGFTLPFENLDNSGVFASLKLEGKSYDFKIYADSIRSDEISVGEEMITMHCDRSYGRVFFTKKSGGGWSIPLSSEYNNLTVTAYKTEKEHAKKVAAMTRSKKIDGSVITGGEAVTAFWGSRISPSSIILSSPKNPLYFPCGSEHILGAESEISDIVCTTEYLYVFKDCEVYKSAVKPVVDRADYPLSFSLALRLPTAPAKNTIVPLTDKILFADEKGNVYSVKMGSSPLCRQLYEGNKSGDFALSFEDKYLLIKDDSALILQFVGDKLLVGEWNFERRCVGAIYTPKETLFFFGQEKDGGYALISARLNGKSAQGLSTVRIPLLEDKGKNRLNAVTLLGSGGEFTFNLLADDKRMISRRGNLKSGRQKLLLGSICEKNLAEFNFIGAFSLEKIKLEYTKKG